MSNQQWEYKTDTTIGGNEEKLLTRYAADGWRLHSVTHRGVFIFERPAPDEK